MTRVRPIILYEDSLPPDVRAYGPHALVLACVNDEIADPIRVRDLLRDARPQNGSTKLLAALRRPESRPRIAIIDDDEIRRALGVPATATDAEVIAKIVASAGVRPDQLTVFLLSRNLETLIIALRDCGHANERIPAAMKKDLVARDGVFNSAAAESDRRVRDCVRKAVPSFDRVIRHLVSLFRD